jgi:hypothetical protein
MGDVRVHATARRGTGRNEADEPEPRGPILGKSLGLCLRYDDRMSSEVPMGGGNSSGDSIEKIYKMKGQHLEV